MAGGAPGPLRGAAVSPFPSEAYDAWKTTPPDEEDESVETDYPFDPDAEPDDPGPDLGYEDLEDSCFADLTCMKTMPCEGGRHGMCQTSIEVCDCRCHESQEPAVPRNKSTSPVEPREDFDDSDESGIEAP